MPYYPLSQIQTDLFTNGEEYALISDFDEFNPNTPLSPYKGPYFITSEGKSFTGKTPTIESIELIPLNPVTSIPIDSSTPSSPQISSNNFIYITDGPSITDNSNIYDNNGEVLYSSNSFNYISNSKGRLIPSSYYPILTQEQKDEGQFTRYFMKRTNELRYSEIDKKAYDALESKNEGVAYDLYEPASFVWKIKGNKQEIYTSNKAAAISVEQQSRWPGFSKYFKDKFTQFYQEPDAKENLYTNGGEFVTPNGKEYIGPYHIHPEKGAMVGAVHTQRKHDVLTPINIPQTSSIPQSPSTYTPSSSPNIGGSSIGGGGY